MTGIKRQFLALLGMGGAVLRVITSGIKDRAALSKKPQPDNAKDEAFFPSPLSLELYVPPKTDFSEVKHPQAYQEGKWKVLTLLTQERYLPMTNGTYFSTGNHPVEMLLPLLHLSETGFPIDIATLNGKPAAIEEWAIPTRDPAVQEVYHKFLPQLREPLKLSEVIAHQLGDDSDYIAIFIPGGHGVLNEIPQSQLVQVLLDWALAHNKFIITLCHGPAALLAAGIGRDQSPFAGYSVCVFPDQLDEKQNVKIGYLPGNMSWYVGEQLREHGIKVINHSLSGQVHRDRHLLTGDSPLASNNLGILAVDTLLDYIHSEKESG